MKQENNSPGAVKEPSLRDKVVIISQYLGQPYSYKTKKSGEPFCVKMVVTESQFRDGEGTGNFSAAWDYSINGFYEVCVHVKPLSKISDEHLTVLAKTAGFDIKSLVRTYPPGEMHGAEFNHWQNIYFDDNELIFFEGDRAMNNPLWACQLATEWGYALPYKNWSVGELEEFGIFKIVE